MHYYYAELFRFSLKESFLAALLLDKSVRKPNRILDAQISVHKFIEHYNFKTTKKNKKTITYDLQKPLSTITNGILIVGGVNGERLGS